MPYPLVTLYVCSPCNLACQECIMQHHMGYDPKYQMRLDEIEHFVRVIHASGYNVQVTLSGGEPLAWEFINEATTKLWNCPNVVKLHMFTNAILHERLSYTAAACYDRIRVSDYGHNKAAIQAVQAKWSNVQLVKKWGFWRNPREPVPKHQAHPVACMNPEVMVYNQRVYACPHALSISRVMGEPPTPESLSVPLAPLFFQDLWREKIKESYHDEICTRCISNGRVRKLLKRQDVNVSGTKQPELHQLKGLRAPAQDQWK